MCGCLACLYSGVCSSKGTCKNEKLVRFIISARASESDFLNMRQTLAVLVAQFLRKREESKPRAERCIPLYEAARDGTIENLLCVLKEHKSYPPLGKSTGIGDTSARELAGPPAAMEENDCHCSFQVRKLEILCLCSEAEASPR